MAYATNTHAPLGAVTVLRVVNFFIAIKETVLTWQESRQTRRYLARLSDEQLDDIGLTRADIANI